MDKQRRNCKKKKRYFTREAAYFFASTDGLAPYRCPVCQHWHLTSQGSELRRHYQKA